MSRRNRWRSPDEKSAIGDTHVDAAIARLKNKAMTAVAVMTEYNHTPEQTMAMLFRDEELAAVRGAKNLIKPRSEIGSYDISPGVQLGIDLDETSLWPLNEERFYIQHDRVAPLRAFITAVKQVHDQYEDIKAVLRWLNRNATPGGIRYYWPSALQLCPDAPAFADLKHVPVRYSTPAGLPERLQMLKDTAATVAGSLLLPAEAKPRVRNTMWLTFNSITVQRDNVSYSSEQMTYNI